MTTTLQKIYAGKKVLVTGHTGFKGSWLSIVLLELGAEVYGYALEPYTLNDNFVQCGLDKKMHHKIGDIRHKAVLESYIHTIKPDMIFHLAAQPLVLESYNNPTETFETNVMGTVNILDIVRQTDFVKVLINVTSDKCYDNKEWVWGYRENDPMGGKDPYSASKGAAELVFHAFHQSYFNQSDIRVASVRAGNVIGGGDWASNRIIPDFFRAFVNHQTLQIRNPNATRPWQFVLEPLFGYLILAARLWSKDGKKYEGGWNFGPQSDTHQSVEQLINQLKSHAQYSSVAVHTINPNHHEAHLLKLDITKAMTYLQWRPVLNFKDTIDYTIQGYSDSFNTAATNLYDCRVKQVEQYINKMVLLSFV